MFPYVMRYSPSISDVTTTFQVICSQLHQLLAIGSLITTCTTCAVCVSISIFLLSSLKQYIITVAQIAWNMLFFRDQQNSPTWPTLSMTLWIPYQVSGNPEHASGCWWRRLLTYSHDEEVKLRDTRGIFGDHVTVFLQARSLSWHPNSVRAPKAAVITKNTQ